MCVAIFLNTIRFAIAAGHHHHPRPHPHLQLMWVCAFASRKKNEWSRATWHITFTVTYMHNVSKHEWAERISGFISIVMLSLHRFIQWLSGFIFIRRSLSIYSQPTCMHAVRSMWIDGREMRRVICAGPPCTCCCYTKIHSSTVSRQWIHAPSISLDSKSQLMMEPYMHSPH